MSKWVNCCDFYGCRYMHGKPVYILLGFFLIERRPVVTAWNLSKLCHTFGCEPGLKIVVKNLGVLGKVLSCRSVKPSLVFENICRAQQLGFTVGRSTLMLSYTPATPTSVPALTSRASGGSHSTQLLAIFRHVARQADSACPSSAFRIQVNTSVCRLSSFNWKRRPGRSRNRWIDQIRQDSGTFSVNTWIRAIIRGHDAASS